MYHTNAIMVEVSILGDSFFPPVSFDSPMLVSSPDIFATKSKSKEFVDIDLVEDTTTGKYASEIFSYLKEAEVSCKFTS